jgi:cytochrome c-type biogenesis protein CcmE
MKPKRRRLYMVLAGMVGLGIAAALILSAFQDNLVFFYSPSDVQAKEITPGQRVRVGGLVVEGSVHRNGSAVEFRVTDLVHTVPVRYSGILPDLFREGQGVVTEGTFAADGTFVASNVLAKHDENYMPKEVVDSLKAAGEWKGTTP